LKQKNIFPVTCLSRLIGRLENIALVTWGMKPYTIILFYFSFLMQEENTGLHAGHKVHIAT
jgi:hypothetical protein